jgi:pimeloyl-ACP methyl ester carboxylesterase
MVHLERPEPEPFRLRVDPRALDLLRARLERARWARLDTQARGSDGWARGTDPAYLRDLMIYWKDSYSWEAAEAKLSDLPQFTVELDETPMHFVHARGNGPSPLPLLLLHGWPDCFYRFHKVIPIFSDPDRAGISGTDSFHVVAPSLPGFAFTPALRGLERPNRHTARLLWQLMTRVLGYDRFVVVGGDGGSVLAQLLAILYPNSVLGIHLTDIGWHATNVDPASVSKTEGKYLEEAKEHFMHDGAYAMVQASQPRSLAAALNDSPIGLASWILDRFHSWTDDRVEGGVTVDDLLTNITLYWVTQTIGSSIFSYFAETRSPSLTPRDRVNVPTAVALFPKDGAGQVPRSFAERTLRVVRWTEMPEGGHFAALEVPELFARDVIDFCRPFKIKPSEDEASHVGRTV